MKGHPWIIAGAMLVAGCMSQSVVQVADLSKARVGDGDRVVVDGRADESAWTNAATMPFEETGKAMFLWDDQRLYGFVGKHDSWFFDLNEQIAVSVFTSAGSAELFFEGGGRGAVLMLREARAINRVRRVALATNAVTVASPGNTCQQGYDWAVEFALDWRSFCQDAPSKVDAQILVYRLAPKRPITHAVGMRKAAATTDAGKQ